MGAIINGIFKNCIFNWLFVSKQKSDFGVLIVSLVILLTSLITSSNIRWVS